MENQTIAKYWQSFERKILPKNISEPRKAQTKAVFYCGFGHGVSFMIKAHKYDYEINSIVNELVELSVMLEDDRL